MFRKTKYYVKRVLTGRESGIVEKVEELSPEEKINIRPDEDGNYPKKVYFRDPLGDLRQSNSGVFPRFFQEFKKGIIRKYVEYISGEEFPIGSRAFACNYSD